MSSGGAEQRRTEADEEDEEGETPEEGDDELGRG